MVDGKKIEELLPCPFCGGEAHLVIEDKFSRFRCGQCGATGAPAEYGREYDATAAWNRRASHLLASASGGEKSRGTLAGFDCQMQTAYVCTYPACDCKISTKGGDANESPVGNNTRRSATDATSPGVTAGASNKDGSHEVKLTPGWLARDIAIASARLQPQVSVSEGEDAELCGRLEHLHNMLPAAVGWTVEERDAPKEAAARIRSLSSRVEEAGRARREEELREDARLGAALARAEAAETRSAELARALNELIIAADSLATTANLSQADREIDRALSALAGHDAAIRAGGDDA